MDLGSERHCKARADIDFAAPGRPMERLMDRLPRRLQSVARWLHQPCRRWLRICVGMLLVCGSLLSILPIFGLWMLPIGLLLLAEDVPMLRRALDRLLCRIERSRHQWLQKTVPRDSQSPPLDQS